MKKSSSYRETIRRHRILLSVPIVVATLIAGWLAVGATKSYESTTSLWVSNPAYSPANPAALSDPPAANEQTLLTELLSTRKFLLTVGQQSGLGQYLSTHSSSGSGPLALLGGGGGGSVDDRIMGALNAQQVVTVTPGPQVLAITLTGPAAAVTQSALRTLVSNLQQQGSQLLSGHARNTIQVVDPATLPAAPTAGKKKQIEGILAGVVAGVVISLLGTVALTRRKTDPWEDEGPPATIEPIELAEPMAAANGASQPAGLASPRPGFGRERRFVSSVRKTN